MTEQKEAIWSEDRCKKLMKDLGQPDNVPLKLVLDQVANEVEQKTRAELQPAFEKGAVRHRVDMHVWQLPKLDRFLMLFAAATVLLKAILEAF